MITNTGDENLSVTAASLTNLVDYQLSPPFSPFQLAPRERRTITVVFDPTVAAAAFTATLRIASNAGAVARQLTGQGTRARIVAQKAFFGLVSMASRGPRPGPTGRTSPIHRW